MRKVKLYVREVLPTTHHYMIGELLSSVSRDPPITMVINIPIFLIVQNKLDRTPPVNIDLQYPLSGNLYSKLSGKHLEENNVFTKYILFINSKHTSSTPEMISESACIEQPQ